MFFRFKKSIVVLLVVAFVAPWAYLSNPPKAEAIIPVADAGNMIQNTVTALSTAWLHLEGFVLNPLAIFAARLVLILITHQIINWINSGFQGQPAFMNDPVGFFGAIADQATGMFFNQLGLDGLLCSGLSPFVQIAIQQDVYMPQIELYRCTLSQVIDNMDAFRGNFAEGGWRGWLVYNQPQNNPYGAYLAASMGLVQHQQTALQHSANEVGSSQGFLTLRSCVERNEFGDCTRWQTETPGSILVSRINHVLGSPMRQGELAKTFQDAVGAIFTALINQLVTQGLRSLSAPGSPWGGGAEGILGAARQNLIAQIQRTLDQEHREWQRQQLQGFIQAAQNAGSIEEIDAITQEFMQFVQSNPLEANPNPGAPPIEGDDLPPEDIPPPPDATGFVGDTSLDNPG